MTGIFPAKDMDQGRKGSAAAAAAPEVGVVVQRWKGKRRSMIVVHSQILRIRAEDSNIGQDIGEGSLSLSLSLRDELPLGVTTTHYMVLSRPPLLPLPASPLSNNASY
ncbi:hypothetical protein Salat_1388000 [Sesamum alatum]|uniref:Uncharacterized protein n=1 Tax=Sesamum alatum TaxID=300844 RepID=A0AAE1Y9V1_9LAMI|nr:hypothetical protein Salat_1388000 [Sesamum alatum]